MIPSKLRVKYHLMTGDMLEFYTFKVKDEEFVCFKVERPKPEDQN